MIGIISQILLVCFLTTGICAQTAILSDQEIETITNQYEKQTKSFLEKYTNPEFLSTVEHPERTYQEKQNNINATLIFSFNNPLSTINRSFGIYVYDLLLCTYTCGSWFLEWILYKQLSKICESHEKNKTKLLTIIIGYVVTSLLLRHTGEYFLLNGPPTPIILNNKTPSLCGTLACQFPTIINAIANPQTWTVIINNYFKQLGLLPTWTNYWSYEITKQIAAMIIFAWWYQRSYKKQQTFIEWTKTKTVALTSIHCLVDVGIAIPVYIKIIRWAYGISKQILHIFTDSDQESIQEVL